MMTITEIPPKPSLFDNSKYLSGPVTVEFLDTLALKVVQAAGGSWWAQAWAVILLVGAVAYVMTRHKLLDAEKQLASQRLEQWLAKYQGKDNEVTK